MKYNQIVVASRSFGRISPEGPEMLQQAGFQLAYLPNVKSIGEELTELMSYSATVGVIAGGEPITAEMIAGSPNLKVIAMHGVGLSHIDQAAAQQKNVVVKAVPGGNAEAVADLTWGLMFTVARKIAEADASMRRGEYGKFFGTSINDKTLGIVGFGAVGQAVARRASGFNMKILAYDVYKNEEAAALLNAQFVSLETILAESDFITLHVPLMDTTIKLINKDTIALMKETSILVNVSRGAVVDDDALYNALVEGRIAGAGIDVYVKEPPPQDFCLFKAPNCVFTPHIGGRTLETIEHIGIETAKNILTVLK